MLYCVYSLFVDIVTAFREQVEQNQQDQAEWELDVPTALEGYKIRIQNDSIYGKYNITVNTCKGNKFGEIQWNMNSDANAYILYNMKGQERENGVFSLSSRPSEEEAMDLYAEDYEYTYSVTSHEMLSDLPICTMVLDIDGSVGSSEFDEKYDNLDLQFFPALRDLNIQNNSFPSVHCLSFSSLRYLENISIGKNCFTSTPNLISTKNDRAFHVCGCSSLQSITIGEYSLSECKEFILEDCPQLSMLNFSRFVFFNSSSFRLRGRQ